MSNVFKYTGTFIILFITIAVTNIILSNMMEVESADVIFFAITSIGLTMFWAVHDIIEEIKKLK